MRMKIRRSRTSLWLTTLLLATTAAQMPGAYADDPDFKNNDLIQEVFSTPETDAAAWEVLYSAYACVCHHKWVLADTYLMEAMKQGAADQMLQSRSDLAYLCKGLNKIAQKRKHASVTEATCQAQVLQALLISRYEDPDSGIDALKRVVVNNPTYTGIEYLKRKIQAMEFERNCEPWMTPPDVVHVGGNRNRFSKWNLSKFPLKVYIPPDAVASKVRGYRAGDGKIFRRAFDLWQKQSNGKIQFIYESAPDKANIRCSWVSEQKQLALPDAIGVCTRYTGSRNYISKAEIQILTFGKERTAPTSAGAQFRVNSLFETCLHEIGHSLGLNHSPSDKDVMYYRANWHPVIAPTGRDLAAMNSLYLTNLYEYIGAALDATDRRDFDGAVQQLDKAIQTKPKDSQAREAICYCLETVASDAMHWSQYETAIKALTKAQPLVSDCRSPKAKELLDKYLHHSYIQAGRQADALAMEKQNPALATTHKDGATFLDKYGLKRESLPYYEEALAKHPDDLAIREKFCFLLVLLAKDELNKNNDPEAIALLLRAKALLRMGMSEEIVDKVISSLRRTYEYGRRYREADALYGAEKAFLPPPPLPAQPKKRTAEEDIADLVAAAKKTHPEAWGDKTKQQAQYATLKQTYEQYAAALRQAATMVYQKNESGWAAILTVKLKRYDGKPDPNPLKGLFELRRHLIALTNLDAVIAVEIQLAFD